MTVTKVKMTQDGEAVTVVYADDTFDPDDFGDDD